VPLDSSHACANNRKLAPVWPCGVCVPVPPNPADTPSCHDWKAWSGVRVEQS